MWPLYTVYRIVIYVKKRFSSKAALRNHLKKHLMNTPEFFCEVCNKKFNKLEDAQAHAKNPCGKISESKEPEENIEFDCSQCKVFFKNMEDYYKHANKCTEVLEPLICRHCNIELISKAGLKKHIEKCNTESPFTGEESNIACTNGPECKFFRQGRCLYYHEEENDQPWERVQQSQASMEIYHLSHFSTAL